MSDETPPAQHLTMSVASADLSAVQPSEDQMADILGKLKAGGVEIDAGEVLDVLDRLSGERDNPETEPTVMHYYPDGRGFVRVPLSEVDKISRVPDAFDPERQPEEDDRNPWRFKT